MKIKQIKDLIKNTIETPEEREVDSELYKIALEEIENKETVKGIWAKAISVSEGDEKKAEANYLKLRVKTLKDENQRDIQIDLDYEMENSERLEYERKNAENLEKATTESAKSVGGIIGFYRLLSFPAFILGLVLLFIGGEEETALIVILYSLIFASPYLITKYFLTGENKTYLDSKNKITKLYIITIIVSLLSYILGWILAVVLIYKLIKLNDAFKDYPKRENVGQAEKESKIIEESKKTHEKMAQELVDNLNRNVGGSDNS